MNDITQITNLKQPESAFAELGKRGGIASQNARRERKEKMAAFATYLRALPGQTPWLVDAALLTYATILRGLVERQGKHGAKRPRSRDAVWATSRLEDLIRHMGGRLEHCDDSTTSPPSLNMARTQPAAPVSTPTQPKPPAERVFTEAEFMALPREEQNAWLCNRNGTYEIIPAAQP